MRSRCGSGYGRCFTGITTPDSMMTFIECTKAIASAAFSADSGSARILIVVFMTLWAVSFGCVYVSHHSPLRIYLRCHDFKMLGIGAFGVPAKMVYYLSCGDRPAMNLVRKPVSGATVNSPIRATLYHDLSISSYQTSGPIPAAGKRIDDDLFHHSFDDGDAMSDRHSRYMVSHFWGLA